MSEVVEIEDNVKEVSCDGGKRFGHPKVYLTVGDDGVVECYYCSRRFQRKNVDASNNAGAA